jgi:methylmalonyl-CoA epimerase
MSDENPALMDARARLDLLDANLIELLAARFKIIEEVAAIKQKCGVPVMQSERVKSVLDRISAAALNTGLKKTFIDRLWRELIAEACRIENEIIGAPNGDLEFQGIRIDHVAIAVEALEPAVEIFKERLGFVVVDRWSIDGEFSGMDAAVMKAGQVTFVVVQGTSPESNVSKYIEAYGPGVQHIAIEVDDILSVRNRLVERGLNLIGDIYEAGGLRQAFSDRNPITGMQIEIVSRTAAAGFQPANVASLFRAMEAENVF